MIINFLPSIGELHHHDEPIIAYHTNYIHERDIKVRRTDMKVIRARSAEQPAVESVITRLSVSSHHPLQAFPYKYFPSGAPETDVARCKPPPPIPRYFPPPMPPTFAYAAVYPPSLQNAIHQYDFCPYWPTPTVNVIMGFTGDLVCTLGPEFWMLGVSNNFGTILSAERYVSAHLQRRVRIASIGNTKTPGSFQMSAEILAREKTITICVLPVPPPKKR